MIEYYFVWLGIFSYKIRLPTSPDVFRAMHDESPEVTLTKAQQAALADAVGALLSGSTILREIFTTMLNAWSRDTTAAEADFWKDKIPSNADDLLKNRIANLRKKIHGHAFQISKGRECEIVVPSRTPYRIRLVQPRASFLRRLWSPHFGHRTSPVLIRVFERLFFRYKHTIYIRHLKVNRPQDAGKLVRSLPIKVDAAAAGVLQPSLHYVSSGELRAAITLQNLFVKTFHCPAELNDGGDPESDDNLIVIGSANAGAADLQPFSSGKYRIFHGGIRPGFHDHDGGGGHRVVHVLLTRRNTGADGPVQTILEGCHGRAVQGVCAALTSDQLARSILERFGRGTTFPDQFQVVVGVELAFNPRHGVHLPVPPVKVLAATRLDSGARPRKSTPHRPPSAANRAGA